MPHLPLALLLASGAAEVRLGTELRQDGYVIRPPVQFRMTRMDLYAGTQVGAVSGAPFGNRWLSAALVDGDGPDAASLLVAVVDGSFRPTPSSRDELSAAVVRHFADELSLKFSMERAELVSGSSPRIEVLGSVRLEDQLRYVLVAAMAGEGRHAVVTFSSPSGRWESLEPSLEASLNSFRFEAQQPAELPRGVAGAAAALFAGMLSLSVWAWRRRRRAEREEAFGR